MGDTDHYTDAPSRDAGEDRTLTRRDAIGALAGVLYPTDIEVTDDFFQTYLYSRIADGDAYETELQAAVETLDGLAESRHGGVFRTLDTAQRESVVTETDVRSGDSDPDGTDIERLNYHLVDELLFACYASPTGGGLVGNENPRGWPGGFGHAPEVQQ